MAGAGYKLFNTGDVLTAAQVNTYLQEQTVMVFADSAARTTALSGVLAEGMVSYLQDTNAVEVYNGSAWVGVSGAGDVTEVQAGTGISVASGTGPIPVVTNTMATAVDAKGDLIVGTGADTFARLAVGTNGYTLVADSVEATGLKWAAPASTTYTSYTPSFTGFTLGNGTVDTGYITLDQLIIYHGVITFGTTSSFSGTLRVSVPSNIKSEGGNGAFFIPTESATFSDASASLDFPLHVGGFSATNIAFISPTVSTYLRAAAANYVEGTIPVAWAANDQISWTYTYRKA